MTINKRYPVKKLFFYAVAFFCVITLSYKTFFYADKAAEKTKVAQYQAVTRLGSRDLSQLQEGDFILRRGFGYFSNYIAANLNKGPIDVTHAGIIVKRNGNWCVIHALSSDVSDIDGVQLQPLNDFLHYSAPGKIIVTRAKNASPAFGKKIAQLATGYLKKQVPFDHNGIIDNDSELFCTELIWTILEKDLHYVTLPLGYEARKKIFYAMDPMYSTDYFDIIINQYRNRP